MVASRYTRRLVSSHVSLAQGMFLPSSGPATRLGLRLSGARMRPEAPLTRCGPVAQTCRRYYGTAGRG